MNNIQLNNLISGSSSMMPFLISMFSVWGLGLATYLLRRVPSRIWHYFLARFTISITMNTFGNANLAIVQSFFRWYMQTKWSKHSRRFTLDATHRDREIGNRVTATGRGLLGPGFGINIFFFENKFGWFSRGKNSNSNTDLQEVTVYFFGTDISLIERFVESLKPKKQEKDISIYTIGGMRREVGWEFVKTKTKRSINSVIINRQLKNDLLNQIKEFFACRVWYEERSITHKLTYLFHGEPGTGKSSLIFALASYFNKPIYMVNLNTVDDATFQQAMDRVPEDAFIVFEDVDVGQATAVRDDSLNVNEVELPKPSRQKISMSTILNTLDGIASMSNNVVFLSTNHPENLDPALTRKGRVDKIIEIPKLKDPEIRDYITVVYPNWKISDDIVFDSITGADIQGHFLDNKNDFNNFIKELKTI